MRFLQIFLIGVVALTAFTACKPRKSGLRSATLSDKELEKIVASELNDVNALVLLHKTSGQPVIEASEAAKLLDNTLPLPAGCDGNVWKADSRWSSEPIQDLLHIARRGRDSRSRTAAWQGVFDIAFAQGFVCKKEFVADGLLEYMRSNVCGDFSDCGRAVALIGATVRQIPESGVLNTAIDMARAEIKNLKAQYQYGLNVVEVLEFKLKSYEVHRSFYALTQIGKTETQGKPLVLTNEQYQELMTQLGALNELAFEKLFMVTQWQSQIKTSPALVKNLIVNDMIGDLAKFGQLDEDIQTIIIDDAMGFFSSASEMMVVNQAMQIYANRLLLGSPEAWLAKLNRSTMKWIKTNQAFDFQTTEVQLPTLEDLKTLKWEESLHPTVAFFALSLFLDREIKLPYRGLWVQNVLQMYERIPAAERDARIQSAYIGAREGAKAHRTQLLARLESGVIKSTTDVEAKVLPLVEEHNRQTKEMINQLLTWEEDAVRMFPNYASVYDDVVTLYERIAQFAMTVQRIQHELAERSVAEFERNEMLGDMEQASSMVMDQWLRMKCIHRIIGQNKQQGASLRIEKEKFFLDRNMEINFDCGPQTTGESLTDLQGLTRRIGNHTSTLVYNRMANRELSAIKEAAAVSIMLVAGLPAGIAGAAAASGVRFVIQKAATHGMAAIARRQMIQSAIVGFTGLLVNLQVFEAVMGLGDRGFSQALGIQTLSAEKMSLTWGQYLYHQTQGLAVFASLSHVSRLGRVLAKYTPGSGGRAATKELSTLLAAKQSVLKDSFRMKTLTYGWGTAIDTGFFFSTGMLGAYVGKDILQVYGAMDKETKVMAKLREKNANEQLYHAFMTALVFRTHGLMHQSESLPEVPEYVQARESVRSAINNKMTTGQAYSILGIPSGASTGQIEAARKRLLVKYHPDRTMLPFRQILEQSNLSAEARELLVKEANAGTDIAVLQKHPNWPSGIQGPVLERIENGYRQVLDHVIMYKQINGAAALLGIK